jgi:glycosyltransferase involved in cell wall biosynthesis
MTTDRSVDLSVVITTKDRPQLLARAVASVLDLDIEHEVVVVDDGSAVPPHLPSDPRVRLVRHTDSQGANGSRNDGLAHARGRWVVFLDDDDELVPAGVRAALGALSEMSPDAAVIGTVVTVDERNGARHRHVPRSVSRGTDWLKTPRFDGHHAHNSLMAPTALLRRIGGFNPAIRSWTHDELFLRLLLVAEIRAIEDDVYVMYENPGRSTVRRQYLARADGILRTLAAHDRLFEPDSVVTADLSSSAAWHLARGGEWENARRLFWCAVRAEPWRRRTWARAAYALGGDRAYEASRVVLERYPQLGMHGQPRQVRTTGDHEGLSEVPHLPPP